MRLSVPGAVLFSRLLPTRRRKPESILGRELLLRELVLPSEHLFFVRWIGDQRVERRDFRAALSLRHHCVDEIANLAN